MTNADRTAATLLAATVTAPTNTAIWLPAHLQVATPVAPTIDTPVVKAPRKAPVVRDYPPHAPVAWHTARSMGARCQGCGRMPMSAVHMAPHTHYVVADSKFAPIVGAPAYRQGPNAGINVVHSVYATPVKAQPVKATRTPRVAADGSMPGYAGAPLTPVQKARLANKGLPAPRVARETPLVTS